MAVEIDPDVDAKCLSMVLALDIYQLFEFIFLPISRLLDAAKRGYYQISGRADSG